MQDRFLKVGDPLTDAANCSQELFVGLCVRLGQFFARHADRFGGKFRAIDAGRVIQHRRQTFCFHIAANPLDNLHGRQRLSEDFDGTFPTGFADDISFRTEPAAQLAHGGADVFTAAVDATDGKHGKLILTPTTAVVNVRTTPYN